MAARDDSESIGLFEPLVVSEGAKSRPRLNDLATSLASKTTALSLSVAPAVAGALAPVLAITNSHYSNSIEGHDTSPVDIERAACGDYSVDEQARDLQIEAVAHMAAQRWIDRSTSTSPPFSTVRICEIHRQFYEHLPPELRRPKIGAGDQTVTIEPGSLRSVDVKIGRHVAVSPGAVPRFLERLEQAYNSSCLIDQIVIAACGHHRLLWVHPFPDGNGRVARLFSHGALNSAINATPLWSLSRGLSRREEEYRMHLQACDEPRRGSLDGRGTLSECALAHFAEFFIETCIQEVDFISDQLEPARFTSRTLMWANEEVRAGRLPPGADAILAAILRGVELHHFDVATLVGCEESQAQSLTAALVEQGIVRREKAGSSLQLAFPVRLAPVLLTGIF